MRLHSNGRTSGAGRVYSTRPPDNTARDRSRHARIPGTRIPAVFLFLLSGLCTAFARWDVVESLDRRFPVSGRIRLEIRNTDGPTSIAAGESSQVFVQAVKEVKGALNPSQAAEYASRVEVRIERLGDRIEVAAKYPDNWPSGGQVRVEVGFKVRTPAGSDVIAATKEGPLDISGLDGNLDLATTGGKLTVERCSGFVKAQAGEGSLAITEAGGYVEANTMAGYLKVEGALQALNARTDSGRIEIHILPGSIMKDDWAIQGAHGGVRIYLPDKFAADLDVSTSDAEIFCDHAIEVAGELAKRRLTGKINGGGRFLRIHSTDGNVHILR